MDPTPGGVALEAVSAEHALVLATGNILVDTAAPVAHGGLLKVAATSDGTYLFVAAPTSR